MDDQADEQRPPQDDPGGRHIQQRDFNSSSEQHTTKTQKLEDPEPGGNRPGTKSDEGELKLRFCTYSAPRKRAQFRSSSDFSVTKGPNDSEGPGMSTPYDNEKRLKELDPTPTNAEWQSVYNSIDDFDGIASAKQLRKGSGKNNLNKRGIHTPLQERVGKHRGEIGSRSAKPRQSLNPSTKTTWEHPVSSSTRRMVCNWQFILQSEMRR